MKLILLSGGSGKRLWPLSNDARSKQFLKVLKNEAGQLESMVQRVWRQLNKVGLADSAYIATSKTQVDMIHNQLGTEIPVIVEPERRDTFPAIALAATYLYSEANVDPEESVCVLPVDPYVEDSFFEGVKELENALKQSKAEFALMGVTPTYPSEKYGYIVPEFQGNDLYAKVGCFKEKPSEEGARELIKQGSLWNCGVFAFKLKDIISKIVIKGFSANYGELCEQYSELPKISFDYEIVEKATEIIVLPYSGSWKDLGTWNTLTEEMSEIVTGKGVISKDSVNSHLINEIDIPIAVLGLSNVVIAASPDGILVSEKGASPRVKEIMSDYKNRPMFEERRWGWYRVLDHFKSHDGLETLTKRIEISAGKNLSYQMHNHRNEVWTIANGKGEVALDGLIYQVGPGDMLQIPMGRKHGIKAITDIEMIEIQMGKELIEEDIIRVFLQWNEVETHCRRAIAKPLVANSY